MNLLRNSWFYIGICIAFVLTLILLVYGKFLSPLQVLLLISFISLLLHQGEEYIYPGYFPQMMNQVMFLSTQPDRYPLNTNTALIVNVFIGWTVYIAASVLAEKAVWLAITAIVISCGNIIAHTLLFNIRGKTLYNPGMITALLLFLPISIYFFVFITQHTTAHASDYLIGISLGIALNYYGVFTLIEKLGNKQTRYIFPKK